LQRSRQVYYGLRTAITVPDHTRFLAYFRINQMEQLQSPSDTVTPQQIIPKTVGPKTGAVTPRRPRQPKRPPDNELADLSTWLGGLDLGIRPAVHVNGAAFATCVLTVDFGTPRKNVRLTTEQSSELVTRLRAATKTVMAREVKVGVMTDYSAGIWWTTAA
jgi:hypothetical protein